MGSTKPTSAAGRRLASVALTLGMLRLQSRGARGELRTCKSANLAGCQIKLKEKSIQLEGSIALVEPKRLCERGLQPV